MDCPELWLMRFMLIVYFGRKKTIFVPLKQQDLSNKSQKTAEKYHKMANRRLTMV